jgi:hypothetical protein
MRSLNDQQLNAFQQFLQKHRLATKTSPESSVLAKIGNEYNEYLHPVKSSTTLASSTPKETFRRSTVAQIQFAAGAQRLADFLRVLLSIIDRTPNTSDNPLLHTVYKDTDFYLPFRCKALSWQRMVSAQGPLHSTNTKSAAGLFSVMVWHGITFRVEVSMNPEIPVLFQDLDDFTSIVAMHTESQCCRLNAYGTAAKARHTKNALAYWKLANDSDYESLVY